MPNSEIIGKRIKELRESKKYSQETLANMIGTATSTISMYESGERIPRDEIKVKIAIALEKSVNYIFYKE